MAGLHLMRLVGREARGTGAARVMGAWRGERRGRGYTTTVETDFTHVVVGGGVVGLAIARALAMRGAPGENTVLLERNAHVGMETSSRNSEVIHAGLYYGPTSLKTELCIRGRQMMYELCGKYRIPHRRTGKWIVAQDDAQMAALEKLHLYAQILPDTPTRFVSTQEAATQEPAIRARAGVLESPTTGIVDSHALMTYLQGDLEDRGGDVALNCTVTDISPLDSSRGYLITTRDMLSGEESQITTATLVNAAGLGAIALSNLVLPPPRHRTAYYAKGNYFSYPAGAIAPHAPRRLIYPAPHPGLGGLGTHLTLDMAGGVRFGPDVEWVTDPTALAVSAAQRAPAELAIREFLPALDPSKLQSDYAGIRPKLAGRHGEDGTGQNNKGEMAAVFAHDFYIRPEPGFPGFINLLGIESPGLTSSLAIAERVVALFYR